MATPEIRPPPPTGTTSASSCGTSSSISSASVPWPAITWRIVIGMDEGEALLAAASSRAVGVGLDQIARPAGSRAAPKSRVCLTLLKGVVRRHHDGGGNAQPPGMIGDALGMIAGAHRRHAARFSSVIQRQQALSAPRSLNEAVNCRFSNFSQTSQPAMPDKVREWRVGVRTRAPANARGGGADVGEGDGEHASWRGICSGHSGPVSPCRAA